MDTVLRCWCRKVIDPLLTFHASSIGLANISRTRLQVQGIRGDEVLALRRLPVGALARVDVHDVHCVDLFETAAARFAKEEVHNDSAEEVACGEDVTVTVIDGAGDEWCEERDEEVLLLR